MKILENISSGYKRIATGIAIVGFLSMMYLALIPAGSVAQVYGALSGTPISGAVVKIVEWPQYNTTTNDLGEYTINNVPYDNVTGSTYTLRISAPGNGSNSSTVTLTEANPNPAVSMELYPSDPYYIAFLDDRGTVYESYIQVFNHYDFNTTADLSSISNTGANKAMAFETSSNKLGSRSAEELAGGSFIGSVIVNNTRPQSLVQGVVRTISSNTYSIAPSRKLSTATVQYLPFLDDRGTVYDSSIQVFNPYDHNITVNMTGYQNSGGKTTLSYEASPKSYNFRYAGEVAGGANGANVAFVGTVEINTSEPALVQGMVRTIGSKTYSMAPAIVMPVNNISYIPFLNDTDSTFDASVQVFNPYDHNITIDMIGYNMLNGLTTTLSYEALPKSYSFQYAGEIAGGADGANVNFVGSVKVITSEPALVQGMIRTIASKTYTMAPPIILQ